MPRLRKWALRGAAGLALLGLAVYLLRWPLLGGVARGRLEALVADALKGELRELRLSGSLLFGATADDVLIAGGADAPYDELRARRVRASYGFLGAGRLEVRVEGARARFVDRDPEKPPDPLKTLRDVEKFARTFRFPGRLTLRDGEALLSTGLRLRVDEASADETTLRARGQVPGFGEIEARRQGALIEGSASEGPVRRARLERDGRAFTYTATVEGHDVSGAGTVDYGSDDALLRAEAGASAKIGTARASADFRSGRVEGRGELTIDLEDPLRARVRAAGRVSGPLFGPARAWRLEETVATAGRVYWRDLELEDARVDIPEGTLDALTWRASARRGNDRVSGEGRFRNGTLEGRAEARIEDSRPYVPEVAAKDVVIRGRFRADEGVRFSGRLEAGAGELAGVSWTSLAGDFAVGPDGLEAPALAVKGLPYAPDVRLSGSLDFQGRGLRIRARAAAGESEWASVDGTIEEGRFDGRVDGRAAGIVAGGRVRGDAKAFRASLEPGEVLGVRHGPLEIRVEEGRAVLDEAAVERAGASALLGGVLAWSEGRLAGDVRLRSIEIRDVPAGVAALRFTREKDLEIDATWIIEGGAGAELRGRWGGANDLRLRARVPDVASPWARRFLKGLPAPQGGLALDVRARGTAERPEIEGRLELVDVAVENGASFSLTIPLSSDGRRVALSLPETPTTYGRLSLEAKLPLPGAEAPLEGRARLETFDLPVFAPFLPEAIQPYVPPGILRVEASTVGRAWSATAEIYAPVLRPPVPLGEVRDLQGRVTADPSGLRVDKIWGRMGGSTFEATLLREAAGPFRGTLRGRELLAISTPLSHIRVSPDLSFSWEPGRPARLLGSLAVPLALIHEEPGSPGTGTGRGGELAVGGLRLRPARDGGVLVPGVPGMEDVELDLAVTAAGELRVENSVAGARLRAKGRLRGTLAEPAASGVVEALSGEVKLPAAIFVRIEQARVTIPAEAGADPSVHFVGRVGKGDGSIEIRVDGPLARPALNLSSDPPAPKQELLARLAFGHPPGQVAGAALGAFAFRIFEQYTAGWPSADPSDSLLSRLRPTVLNEDEDLSPRRPWELPAGRTARGMVVRTEYLWTPYFSIVGEADRESNVGGDIKLRLRFR